jgi:hypothetical protein
VFHVKRNYEAHSILLSSLDLNHLYCDQHCHHYFTGPFHPSTFSSPHLASSSWEAFPTGTRKRKLVILLSFPLRLSHFSFLSSRTSLPILLLLLSDSPPFPSQTKDRKGIHRHLCQETEVLPYLLSGLAFTLESSFLTLPPSSSQLCFLPITFYRVSEFFYSPPISFLITAIVLFRFQVLFFCSCSCSLPHPSLPQGICALLLFSLSETVQQVWMSDVDIIISSFTRTLTSSSQLSDSSQREKEDLESPRVSLRKGDSSGFEISSNLSET